MLTLCIGIKLSNYVTVTGIFWHDRKDAKQKRLRKDPMVS